MQETERNIDTGGRKRPSILRTANAWLRRLLGAPAGPRVSGASGAAGPIDVHRALHLLPATLDSAAELPNGVVELVVEDAETPGRCLLDIHDGRVSHVEPGSAVPWASIAGSPRAWALALEGGEPSGLRLTGEKHLAERLLAALPGPRSAPCWADGAPPPGRRDRYGLSATAAGSDCGPPASTQSAASSPSAGES